jgi:hypothetical protein
MDGEILPDKILNVEKALIIDLCIKQQKKITIIKILKKRHTIVNIYLSVQSQ